jgi:diacylglycerol kinase (ATP)
VRVSVLYNADAGEGVSKEGLREAIERHGHEILHMVSEGSEIASALEGAPDLLVAAGGDGTVAPSAHAVAGRAIRLAILPLGTANNVARSLGIEGPIDALIEGWTHGRIVAMDLGVAHGAWGETRFIEGAGVGLIPAGIASMELEPSEPPRRGARVARDARGYLDVLSRLKPRRLTAKVDGTPLEGEFLFLEAMNISSVGPNLVLATDTQFSDGLLSVVTAGEEHRPALVEYLNGRIKGRNDPVSLPTRFARQIDIEDVGEIHIDDRVRSLPTRERVSMWVESHLLQVLV